MTPRGSTPLAELASLVGGTIEGDPSLPISAVAGLEVAGPGELSFFSHPRYRQALADTRASAVLLGPGARARAGLTLVRVANPPLAFARLAQHLHPARRWAPGISERAAISPGAEVDPTATVMAFAVVERGAKVGARAVLHAGVWLGEGASVGDDSVLYPNVTVGERCQVGRRCVLHASAVVGSDGFGFAFDAEKPEHVKIPQRGIAVLEDDVELGACATVDRATFGQTLIGRGTKIDNLVQIAHNVTVGPLSILCAQVGVSGSAKLGQGVMLGGQVGISGHLEVGALARVVAQSGVAQDVAPGATLFGSPAIDHRQFLKASAAFPKLPELIKELRALRNRVDALERKGEHP